MSRCRYRDLPLFHGLQQSCLNLGGRPVHHIGKYYVGEDRTRLKLKPLLGILSQVHFGPGDVGG